MGTERIAGLIPLAILGVAWLAGQGRDRSPTLHRYLAAIMVAGAVLMTAQEDWWAVALWCLVCVNALRKPWPARLATRLSLAVLLYGLYVIFQPIADPIQILIGIVTVAILDAGKWLYDREGHWNHHDMLWVMGVACAYSLSLLHHWAWLAAVAFLLPFFLHRMGQANLWFGVAFIAYVGTLSWIPALAVTLSLSAYVLYKARGLHTLEHGGGPDHGRVHVWYVLLYGGWWKTGWAEKLFGIGWDGWRAWADSFSQLRIKKLGIAPKDEATLTHPHNEYIHILFEHGIVGLVLMLGWIGTILFHAWQSAPALIIPGVTLCAIAATSYPWTLPYETSREHKQYIEFTAFGCIGMVIMSLMVLLLA